MNLQKNQRGSLRFSNQSLNYKSKGYFFSWNTWGPELLTHWGLVVRVCVRVCGKLVYHWFN